MPITVKLIRDKDDPDAAIEVVLTRTDTLPAIIVIPGDCDVDEIYTPNTAAPGDYYLTEPAYELDDDELFTGLGLYDEEEDEPLTHKCICGADFGGEEEYNHHRATPGECPDKDAAIEAMTEDLRCDWCKENNVPSRPNRNDCRHTGMGG